MEKRLTREQKQEQALKDIMNKMFEIAGHPLTYDDVKDRQDNWFQQYTMTESQHDEWMEWGRKYLMKSLRIRYATAVKEMMWGSLQWGLKIDFETKE
jgi:hypothetical protein